VPSSYLLVVTRFAVIRGGWARRTLSARPWSLGIGRPIGIPSGVLWWLWGRPIRFGWIRFRDPFAGGPVLVHVMFRGVPPVLEPLGGPGCGRWESWHERVAPRGVQRRLSELVLEYRRRVWADEDRSGCEADCCLARDAAEGRGLLRRVGRDQGRVDTKTLARSRANLGQPEV